MGHYRDDLDAARQRIASLESELADARKAEPAAQGRPARKPGDAPRTVTPQVAPDPLKGYVDGTAIPARVQRGAWAALGAWIVAHALVHWAVLAPARGWASAYLVSFLSVAVVGPAVFLYARVAIDPAVGRFVDDEPRGPRVVYSTRRTATLVLSGCAIVEALWLGLAMPALVRALGGGGR